MNTAYIALGSNLENPLSQVTTAVKDIARLGKVSKQSHWYKSLAVGLDLQTDQTQPEYINGAVCLQTALDAFTLLKQLQTIENSHGRSRTIRWGPRTLDLDILLFNQECINTAELTVPHPRMLQRNFVLYPLCDINEQLILPSGEKITTYKQQLNDDGLEKLV